jgi:hypothetical protein
MTLGLQYYNYFPRPEHFGKIAFQGYEPWHCGSHGKASIKYSKLPFRIEPRELQLAFARQPTVQIETPSPRRHSFLLLVPASSLVCNPVKPRQSSSHVALKGIWEITSQPER